MELRQNTDEGGPFRVKNVPRGDIPGNSVRQQYQNPVSGMSQKLLLILALYFRLVGVIVIGELEAIP
jgi:hypothetical protein